MLQMGGWEPAGSGAAGEPPVGRAPPRDWGDPVVRSLYRIYLYLVCTVLLGFAAYGVGSLLGDLLLRTPLRRADETPPDARAIVQAVVLAAVALIVAAGVGGLHYWLIRRDLAQDAGAAHGAVRTLALNYV